MARAGFGYSPGSSSGGARYHTGDVLGLDYKSPTSGDPKLQALYDANPYANLTYQVGWWDQFQSWLGARSGYDAWKENMTLQAKEYDAQIAAMQYENEYNSPQAQVAREQAAGLNPNLNGGSSIDPGNTDGLPEDTNPPMISQSDGEKFGNVVNGVMSAFTTAVGMVQSFQGIHRNRLSNQLLNLEVSGGIADLVRGVAPDMLPESPDPAGMLDAFDWRAASLSNARRFAGGNLPKKLENRFVSQMENYLNSAVGGAKSYEDFRKRVEQRKGYYLESQTNYDEFDEVLKIISEPFAKASEQIYKLSQKREITEDQAAIAGAQTETQYQNALDGDLMAGAQNSENQVTKETNDSIAILRGSINDIVEKLSSVAKEGGVAGTVASIMLPMIAVLQMNFASGFHPTITRSQSSGSGKSKVSDSSSIHF